MLNCHTIPTMPPPRGAASVCFINDLTIIEQAAISFLRHWGSRKTRQIVIAELIWQLGNSEGHDGIRYLDQIVIILSEKSRRTFLHHDIICDCVGAHEISFAKLIYLASTENKNDAMIFANNLVKPPFLNELYSLAQKFGKKLEKMIKKDHLVNLNSNITNELTIKQLSHD